MERRREAPPLPAGGAPHAAGTRHHAQGGAGAPGLLVLHGTPAPPAPDRAAEGPSGAAAALCSCLPGRGVVLRHSGRAAPGAGRRARGGGVGCEATADRCCWPTRDLRGRRPSQGRCASPRRWWSANYGRRCHGRRQSFTGWRQGRGCAGFDQRVEGVQEQNGRRGARELGRPCDACFPRVRGQAAGRGAAELQAEAARVVLPTPGLVWPARESGAGHRPGGFPAQQRDPLPGNATAKCATAENKVNHPCVPEPRGWRHLRRGRRRELRGRRGGRLHRHRPLNRCRARPLAGARGYARGARGCL